jgi:hypothetical protein
MATARPTRTAAAPPARTPVARAVSAATRPAARGPAARGPARAPQSSGYTGAAGLAKMQEAEEEAKALAEARKQLAGSPFRFYCQPGEVREVVVVDMWLEEVFFRHEHNLKNPRSGKWDIYCACIRDHANCPVCDNTDRGSYFAMYLTVIDLTPFETRDGEQVMWSKKLLVVKQQQHKKFVRLEARAKSEGLEAGMRGMVLTMTRDTDKDAAIGNEIEWNNEVISEEDLQTYVTTYRDQQGKDHEVLGYEPFDYNALFPLPTEQQLRSLVGGRAGPGTRDGDDSAIGRSRSGRPAPRGDDWEGQGGGAAPVVRRPARGAPARAQQEDVEDPDNPEVGAEPEPAPSRRAAAPSRRAPVDTPPPRTSLAARRAQLRR